MPEAPRGLTGAEVTAPLAARDSHRAQEPRSWASKEGDQKNKTQKSTAGGD